MVSIGNILDVYISNNESMVLQFIEASLSAEIDLSAIIEPPNIIEKGINKLIMVD